MNTTEFRRLAAESELDEIRERLAAAGLEAREDKIDRLTVVCVVYKEDTRLANGKMGGAGTQLATTPTSDVSRIAAYRRAVAALGI